MTPLASEIILTVSERRNRQKLTLSSTAAPFVFGRGRDCSFVLRRNNVGEHQFTIEYKNNAWLMQDAGSTTCGTWYNNRYIHSGEEVTLQPGDVIVLLDEHGKEMRSLEFADYMKRKMNTVNKRLVFIIGGPYGFSEKVYQVANEKISMSKMTFSHQMIRLIFVEQIYRAMTILNGGPYHHE